MGSTPDPFVPPASATPAPDPDGLPGPIEAMAIALRRAVRHAPALVPIVLLLSASVPLAAPAGPQAARGAGWLASSVATFAVLLAAHERERGSAASLPRVLGRAFVRWVEAWFSYTSYSALVLPALLLLVVPGLWVLTRASLLDPVLAVGRGGFDGAWELGRGRVVALGLVSWPAWALSTAAAIGAEAAIGVSPPGPVTDFAAGLAGVLAAAWVPLVMYEPWRRIDGYSPT